MFAVKHSYSILEYLKHNSSQKQKHLKVSVSVKTATRQAKKKGIQQWLMSPLAAGAETAKEGLGLTPSIRTLSLLEQNLHPEGRQSDRGKQRDGT